MAVHIGRLAMIMSVALTAAACGPREETNSDVFERYRPKIVAKKEEIARVLEQAPAMTLKPIVGAKKPSFIQHDGMVSFTNVSLIEVDSFKGGDLPDVYLEVHSPLKRIFEWLDFSTGYSPEGRASDYQIAEEIEDALATPYIAFYQQTRYVQPEFTTKEKYKPGGVRYDVILIELVQNAAVASCDAMAMSSEALDYEISEGLERISSESALRRDLAANALREIGKCFSDQTGGEFVFDS